MIGPGSELGPYIVLKQLGAGGMGTVYRAHDRRLGREVALKLLPPEFAGDQHRLTLFKREALTLASLNHPGIATIHGFEEPEPGVMFLILELVDGESLAERIRRGPVPQEEALRIAARIAESLEAAHERGVIHRDLKPGNVMLGPKGMVKVLDFGLARKLRQAWKAEQARDTAAPAPPGGEAETLIAGPEASGGDATLVTAPPPPTGDATAVTPPPEPPSPSETADETVVSSAPLPDRETDETIVSSSGAGADDATLVTSPPSWNTAPEMDSYSMDEEVAGTPGYMSPEQILARPQDARTDIFAFGCILYEMLAGRRPITGRTLADIFDATVQRDVDLTALPAKLSPRIRKLTAQCLARSVNDRLGDIRHARAEIEEVLGIRRASALLAGEASPAHPNNLPVIKDELVGREEETEACRNLLEDTRLLTLTGMGGTGKTRLAVALAHDVLSEYPDGAWFVDLAGIAQAEQVVNALAVAMEVGEEPGMSTSQALLDHLRDRTLLLVLDNCEHLVAAVADAVSMILGGTQGVRILATSREILGVAEEITFAVPPLAVPEHADAQTLRATAAVRLFAARAAQAKHGFELTDANLQAIGEICRRLDGIPLAIELAAARVKVLAVEQIRAKLDDRFKLLTGGSRTALPHQQTLRATMQWSYDHLAPLEQEIFRMLSVFSGGWTLDAAVAVRGNDADEFEILDLLTRLIDKSLVTVRTGRDGENRYGYLETVRQYAGERRDESGETAALAARHLHHFLTLAESAEKALVGPEQKEWLARLDAENANILAAVKWSAVVPDAAPEGLGLVGAAARYWSARGYYELGRGALREVLERPGSEAASQARAKALVRAGGMALYQGDFDAAFPPIEESLAVYRALGDEKGVARSLSGLATVAAYRGDFAAARTFGEEVLEYYRSRGDDRGSGVTLHNLGFLGLCEDAPARAAEAYEAALPHLKKCGDLQHIALTLADLAIARARLGEIPTAITQIVASLNFVRELAARREASYALDAAAEIAWRLEDPGAAARWMGAASAIRREIGASLAPAEKQQRATLHTAISGRIGEPALQEILESAAPLGFEFSVEACLEWLSRSTR